MAKKAELHEKDVKWSLSCTDAYLKADNVNMDVIKRNLTDEMSEKTKRNKKKTEKDTLTFYWWHPNPAKRGIKNNDDDCYLARE